MEQVFAPPKRFSSLESRIWQVPMPGRERVPQENGVAVGLHRQRMALPEVACRRKDSRFCWPQKTGYH